MGLKLPNQFRPSGLIYKQLHPGVDLPAWFVNGIKAVDPDFHFVWHKHRVMYDDVMNQYTGSLDDPRFTISNDGWGFVLTDANGEPVPEFRWHCWRLGAVGWFHIFDVKYTQPEYLERLIVRLGMQKTITERYGLKAYIHFLREERELMDAAAQGDHDQLFKDVQHENKWLMDKAMENFKSGNTAPTNPTKDIISSYKGQTKRGKITRGITDKEGGLILPDEWRDE